MIDLGDGDCAEKLRELRAVVLRLSLMSHVSAGNYESLAPDDQPQRPDRWRVRATQPTVPHLGSHASKGSGASGVPGGGIDVKGDMTPEFRQKSAVYFQRRLQRMHNYAGKTYGEADIAALLAEAQEALRDWMKTPEVSGAEPLIRDSFQWKRAIARHGGEKVTKELVNEVNRLYALGKPIDRQAIYRYRERYRHLTYAPSSSSR